MIGFWQGIAATIAGSVAIGLTLHYVQEFSKRRRCLLSLLAEIKYNCEMVSRINNVASQPHSRVFSLLHTQSFTGCQLTGYIYSIPQKTLHPIFEIYALISIVVHQKTEGNYLTTLHKGLKNVSPELERILKKSWWWQSKIQELKMIGIGVLVKMRIPNMPKGNC